MTNTELKKRRHRENNKRWYRKKAAEFRRLGLSLSVKNWGKPIRFERHDLGKLSGWDRHLARQRIYRSRLTQQGLTIKGTIRKAVRYNTQGMNDRQKRRFYEHLQRQRYIAKGLTSRGKPRKDGLAPITKIEIAWREFRSTMEIPVTKSWADWIPLHGEERNAA